MTRIGCVVCWLKPGVKGDEIGDVVVIHDGNGYCHPHWLEAITYLAEKTRGKTTDISTSLPFLLAGVAYEVPRT